MESEAPAKKKRTTQRATRRLDPPASDDSKSMYILDVQNKDPLMHYAWANAGSPIMGPSRFEMMGYEQVLYDPHKGPKARVMHGISPGEPIVVEGMVLMQCTKEHKAHLDQEGGPGAGLGLRWADEQQKRYIKTSRQGDHMRGQFRPGVVGNGHPFQMASAPSDMLE